MKILQVVARVPSPPVDGGAMYVHFISESLLRLGNELTISGFVSNKHPQDTGMLPGVNWALTDGKYKRYHPIAVLRSELAGLPVTISHRMNRKRYQRVLDELTGSFDVILLEGVFVGHFIPLLRARFPNTPIVLRSSNVEYQILERNARVTRFPNSLIYKRQAALTQEFERKVMLEVDAMTAITESDRITLSSMNPAIPSTVVTAGTKIPDVNPTAEKINAIGCIANWSWVPNSTGLAWFLDQCWPQIKRANPGLQFRVAGGSMPDTLKDRFEKDPDLVYEGFVDNADDFRRSLRALVIPLLSGGGMKLKTLDVMGCRVPFVSTSIGTEGIDVQDGKHCYIADNPQEFANRVNQLLSDVPQSDAMVEAAYLKVKNQYDWDAITRDMLDFLDREVIQRM